jgi:formate-dependent nitrite reductase membrane component NrfD
MVPDAQFRSYYGRPVVKPVPWEGTIPAYLFLGGLAAGSGLVGAGGAVTGRPALRRTGRYAAMASVALGGLALVEDLGRPERALNMMRVVKLTSPMSVGSWILAGFSGFAGAAMAAEVARSVLAEDAPRSALAARRSRWSAGGSAMARVFRVAEPVATAGSAAFAMPLAAYTAVLLADTSTPTWRESYRELPFMFVGSANAAAAGLALITAPVDQNAPVRRLAAVSAAVETVAAERMRHAIPPVVAEPLGQGRAGRLLRASRALTIGGAVGAALFGRHRFAAAVSGAALLAGSALMRFGVFEAGLESARDPRYTIEPQRQRLAERRSRGVVDDSITTPG